MRGALALVLLLAAGGCLLDDGKSCDGDFPSCSGDYVEECSGGHQSTTDCRALCGATCGYDETGNAICLCRR